jgi:hypothetical protein
MRFMVSMGFGLVGITVVLKVLIDQLFSDWDVVEDVKTVVKNVRRQGVFTGGGRAEDRLLDIEKSRPKQLSTRLIDQKREQLRQIDKVESTLVHPIRVDAEPVVAGASGDWSSEWSR